MCVVPVNLSVNPLILLLDKPSIHISINWSIIQSVNQSSLNTPLFSGQLKKYRFLRMLHTLNEEFPTFQNSLKEFIFEKAKKETSELKHQPLPSTITREDVFSFDTSNYHNELMESAPILHAAVSGSMASNYNYGDIEVGALVRNT